MLLGRMCNPEKDVIGEITRTAQLGFDFVEISIESPGARPERNWQVVKDLIKKNGLKVLGSTDYHLQIASPWIPIRKAAMAEMINSFPIFEKLGAEFVHIHLDDSAIWDKANIFKWNSEAVCELCDIAKKYGLKIMVENGRLMDWRFDLLKFVLKENKEAYFHLDVGHANIGVKRNLTQKLLKLFGKRIMHVHLSDNNGIKDQHLQLGKGNINWKEIVRLLKKAGYDKTISLETFNPTNAFGRSKKYFEAIWNKV